MKKLLSMYFVFCCIVFCSCKSPASPTTASVDVRIISFTANSNEVAIGATITLTWKTENATKCEISGIGAVSTSGSSSLQLSDGQIFILTATGKNNETKTAQVEVKVNRDDPCKTIAIATYVCYSTFYHVETSPNSSTFYDVTNVEITVNVIDGNNNVIDWGKGTIPIIRMGEIGKIDVFLQYGRGLGGSYSTTVVTNCHSF